MSITAILAAIWALPFVKKAVLWSAWTVFVAVVFHVRGCNWKADRIQAATIAHRPTIVKPHEPDEPRKPLLPWRRGDAESIEQQQPQFEPTPDPISTPDEQAKRETPADGRELTDLLTTPIGAKPLGDAVKPVPKCVDCKKQTQSRPVRRGFFFRRQGYGD